MSKMSNIPLPVTSIYTKYIKRILDIVLSVLAFIVLLPLMLCICLLELFFHGCPVIYKAKRLGKNNRVFTLYKFRSMTNKRDEAGYLLPEKERLTRFGKFLRKTSIDELPELINIIKGDMSIIGPRPLLIEYQKLYTPRHSMRHSVRPGLACLRVPRKGVIQTKTWTWWDQFENDIFYIENISFMLDVKMIISIIKEVLKGSECRTNDTRVPYTGDNLMDTRSKDEVGVNIHFNSLEGK